MEGVTLRDLLLYLFLCVPCLAFLFAWWLIGQEGGNGQVPPHRPPESPKPD